jgi:hypothetical protein
MTNAGQYNYSGLAVATYSPWLDFQTEGVSLPDHGFSREMDISTRFNKCRDKRRS